MLAQQVEHTVEARSRNGSIPLQATFIIIKCQIRHYKYRLKNELYIILSYLLIFSNMILYKYGEILNQILLFKINVEWRNW